MFFCAFIGEPTQEPAWLATINRHAAWLGLTVHMQSRSIADGRVFSFGWLGSDPPDSRLVEETPERITITTMPALSPPVGPLIPPRNFETKSIRVEVRLRDGACTVAVPMMTSEHFFYAARDDAHALGNDLRLLVRWAGLQLDERGVYALFEYGLLPPALSLSRNVMRLPNGHSVAIQPNGAHPVLEAAFRPPRTALPEERVTEPEQKLSDLLDSILRRVPPNPGVLFSGGADSALVAARLAHLGRTDATLFNFVPHPKEPDAVAAVQIATYLGLRIEQLTWNGDDAAWALQRLAEHYAFPFSDSATLPAVMLVRWVREAHPIPSALLTGEGAMPPFGYLPWGDYFDRLYALPKAARRILGWAYRPIGAWQHDTGLSRYIGAAAQSVHIPQARAAVLRRDSVNGVAYRTPRAITDAIEGAIRERIEALFAHLDVVDQISFWLWLSSEGNQSAPKWSEPLRRYGIPEVSPFTEPNVFEFGYSIPAEQKRQGRISKMPVRSLLEQSIPHELVYRPKRGLVLPVGEAYSDSAVRTFVEDIVLARDNPILDFCRARTVREMFARAQTGKPLSRGARRFLWTLVFTSAWLRQLQVSLKEA